MSRLKITDADLPDILGPLKRGPRGHYIGNCPYCIKEGHFYIKAQTNELDKRGDNKSFNWDCKKCGENGKIYRLLKFLNRLQEFIDKTVDLLNLVKLETGEKVIEEVQTSLKTIKRPVGFQRVFSDSYLEGRGFVKKDFYKYEIGRTDLLSRLQDYIIFCIKEDNEIKGYVSRCTLSKKEIQEKGLLRYRNSKTEFGKLLLGSSEITENTKIVILVEGLFDKNRLDNLLQTDLSEEIKVCCTFGNKVSNDQLKKLLEFDLDKIILFYDIDAIKQIKTYAIELQNCFDEVKIAYMNDGKDPGDADPYDIFKALTNLEDPVVFKQTKVSLLR